MNIKEEVSLYQDELIALRRDFHTHPELGLKEFRTSQIIEDYLIDLGYEVSRCLNTGVIGILKGAYPGKTLMLRADIDALPVNEATNLSFKSKNEGIMHACAHDGHIAILLIVAKILAKHQDKIKGNIKLVFQPNEEDAGAQLMIDQGALTNPKPDAIIGLHLWSYFNTNQIAVVSGPIMASSYYFKIRLKGLQGHGGAPFKAINPINCAANIISAISEMQAQEFDSTKPTVISFGRINAGNNPIIIPEDLELEGSIRCLHLDDYIVRERFKEIVESLAKTYRCSSEVAFKCGNSILNNNEKLCDLLIETAKDVVGESNIVTRDVSVMLGDDFAEFIKDIPGVYYFVGVANKEKATDYEHHHPKFDIDEDALLVAVETQVKLVFNYLNSFE